MLQPSTLQFLKQLSRNNNKPWFDAHRAAYDAAKADVQTFIDAVLNDYAKKDTDLKGIEARECLFRINRDVRFSKDKSPYKTNFGASMKRGGKKSPFAGYYLHIEPGKSFVGGGLWMPDPVTTKKIRQEISYCYDEFRKIVRSARFKSTYADVYRDNEVGLTQMPRGFEKDDPAAGYLKFRSWIALRNLSDQELTAKDLKKKVVNSFSVIHPFLRFLNRAIEE